MNAEKQAEELLTKGTRVIVRTVTHTYVGQVVRVQETHEGVPVAIALYPCAWVADTGSDPSARWGSFLEFGLSSTSEVEPYPGVCVVPWHVVNDVSPWLHDVPTRAQ